MWQEAVKCDNIHINIHTGYDLINRIENSAEFNSSFFSVLAANPFLPVFWIDTDGWIFNVNEAACSYLGYTKEELTSLNINQIDPTATKEMLRDLYERRKTYKIARFETCHRRKDGVMLDIEVVSNYFSIDGFEFSFSFVFDISAKKQQERELVKSNRELAELTASLENLVAEKTKELSDKIKELEKSEKTARLNEELFVNAFKTSQDAVNLNEIDSGVYIQVNDGFLNILGYTEDEVLGVSSLDLNIWKYPEERKKFVASVKKYGYCRNFEADFIRKDGSIVHGLMSASIQEFQGKKVLLNVSKDITQIKKLENELKELNSQLQIRVDREVAIISRQQEIIFEQKKLADMGMMINAIAHQWRQPLNIIGLRTQELADWYKDGDLTDEYVFDFEKQQMDTVEYLSSTIEDFRTFFKPDDKESEFNVTYEIIALLKLIEIQMLAKGIKPYISYSHKSEIIEKSGIGEFPSHKFINTIVKGYRGEFKQVITNLVYNSIYAIEEKNCLENNREEGFIHIRIHKSDNSVTINIEDNGGGIPEDILPHIFNPYFTTKTDGKGTGLGLYLAMLIIQTHMSGTITVNNTEQGANFELTLPSV